MALASGRNAFAVCDRCGFRTPYTEVRREADTGMRVCAECCDAPDPLRRRKARVARIGLRHARPDAPLTPLPPPAES